MQPPPTQGTVTQITSQAPKVLGSDATCKNCCFCVASLENGLLLLLPPPPFPRSILHYLHLFVSLMFSLMSWVGGWYWWSSCYVSGPQRTLETQERGLDAKCWRQILRFHSNPFLSSKPHFLRNHCSNSVLTYEIKAVVSLLHSRPFYLNMRLILCRALVSCISFTATSILNNTESGNWK